MEEFSDLYDGHGSVLDSQHYIHPWKNEWALEILLTPENVMIYMKSTINLTLMKFFLYQDQHEFESFISTILGRFVM